jgi:ADP-ribosylation factor-like protein 2
MSKFRKCLYTLPIFLFQALNLDAIKSHHWQIQGCSAFTGEKLLDGIDWLITDIASRIFTMD